MEVKNLPLGESVIVTGPVPESDDAIVRVERVDEKDREEEDLVLELRSELVARGQFGARNYARSARSWRAPMFE